MINLYVASINRSGASLMPRLFDGHPDIASYPTAFDFPWNFGIFPFVDRLLGSPSRIPDFDKSKARDILKFFDIPERKPEAILKWGREQGDPIGVRKNYLERELYNKVKTDFDYDKFIKLIREYSKNAVSLSDAYEARHKAFFSAWDNGAYSGTMKYVTGYGSGQLFLSNMDKYFEEFRSSFILCPIRDPRGYIASEKTRYARIYYGSRRFAYPRFPNILVKQYADYDLEAHIRSWLVALTRIVIFQEKFGTKNNFLAYRHENILNDAESAMKSVCVHTGLAYNPVLIEPTIAGRPWGGSSHQGKSRGINKNVENYYPEVLRNDEIEMITKICKPIIDLLNEQNSTPVDLTKIPKGLLYDYDLQKKYSEDEEKWALYSALAYRDRRRVVIGRPKWYSIIALIYAQFVRLVHLPRMIKQRYFPNIGRQNYR